MQQSSYEAIPFETEHPVLYSAARTALKIVGEYSLFLHDLIPALLQGQRTPYQTRCRDNNRLDLKALLFCRLIKIIVASPRLNFTILGETIPKRTELLSVPSALLEGQQCRQIRLFK